MVNACRCRLALVAVLTGSLALPPPGEGQATHFSLHLERQVADPTVGSFAQTLRDDLHALALQPAQWRARDWRRLGLAIGAVALVSRVDEDLNRLADDRRSSGFVRLSETIRPVGQEAGLALLAGTWVAGRAFDRPRWVSLSQDGLEASLIASGLLVPALKTVAARTRPRETGDRERFLAQGGGQSFPSGEAAQIFALAAVVAGHAESRWVRGGAYGVAGWVAAQRIAVDAHWTSDVVAGAILGAAVGRWVVRRHRPQPEMEADARRHAWAIGPALGPDGRGLGLGVRLTF